MINLSHLFKDGFSLSKIFTKAKNIIFVFRHFMATKALFNSVVNWFIGRRIDQIERFIAHPYETQKGVLFSQLFLAEDTEYGLKYGFKSISSISDFQNRIPIVSYEDFEPYIEKAVRESRILSYWTN